MLASGVLSSPLTMSDRTNQLTDPATSAALFRAHPHGNLEPRGYAGLTPSGAAQPPAPGRFGRMFPALPALEVDRAILQRLGDPAPNGSGLMVDDGTFPDAPIPAGFTYLGQLIDHDLTFDPTSSLDKQNDPRALRNFRTPRFDLDSLYAGGPADAPYLYDRADPDLFLLGASVNTGPFAHPAPDAAGDLPRNVQGVALLGDPRNDENLVIAQLHRLFLKFHNRVVAHVRAAGTPPALVFVTAQQLVRWHYQWIVVHDYLRRIVDPAIVSDVLAHGRRLFHVSERAFIPVEFSVAAFRFGHSMVRDRYRFHRATTGRPFHDATLVQLFTFTHLETTPIQWVLHPDDWESFFETNPAAPPVRARAIDARLSATLATLPGVVAGAGPTSLATRNLLRGLVMGLPSGQAVATEVARHVPGIVPLTPAELAGIDASGFVAASGLDRATPLWLYLLLEAQLREGGARLGPIGGRIVAEVMLGLLQADTTSYLNLSPFPAPHVPTRVRHVGDLVELARAEALALTPAGGTTIPPLPGGSAALLRPQLPALLAGFQRWSPSLPGAVPGQFTMADLIRFANQ